MNNMVVSIGEVNQPNPLVIERDREVLEYYEK